MAIGEKVARAVVEYTGRDQNFQRTADRVQKKNRISAKSFRNVALAALAAGAALAAAGKSALKTAENISDMANKANASVEGLQKLRFAADQNGASAQDMDNALTRLTRRMSLFANDGTGAAAKAIKALGLEIYDASGNLRQSDEMFLEISDKLKGLATDAERAGLASLLFGEDAGPRLAPLLSQGADGVRKFTDEAVRMGIVLDEAGVRKGAEANAKLRALGAEVKGTVTAAFIENADAINSVVSAFASLIRAVSPLLKALGKVVGILAKIIDLSAQAAAALQRVATDTVMPLQPGTDSGSGIMTPEQRRMLGLGGPIIGVEAGRGSIYDGPPQPGVEPEKIKEQRDAATQARIEAGYKEYRILREMQQEFFGEVEIEEKKHQDRLAGIRSKSDADKKKDASKSWDSMINIFESGNEQMQRIAKIAGAARALINTYVGASEALKLPFPANLGAMAQVISAGMGLVNAIQSGSKSAPAGVPGGGAGAVPPAGASPSGSDGGASGTYVRVNMVGGNMFSGDSVRDLIGKINEAIEDGAIIKGITA